MKKIILALMAWFTFVFTASSVFLFVILYAHHYTDQTIFYFSLMTNVVLFLFSLFLLQRGLSDRHRVDDLDNEISQLHEELREQKNRFKTIFDTTHMGVALLNLDGRFIRVNQALCELLGYVEDEILTMNFYHLIHPNDLNNFQIHVQQLIDKKIYSYDIAQQCFRKNGEGLWVMSTLSLIRDYKEKPLYYIIQIQDI